MTEEQLEIEDLFYDLYYFRIKLSELIDTTWTIEVFAPLLQSAYDNISCPSSFLLKFENCNYFECVYDRIKSDRLIKVSENVYKVDIEEVRTNKHSSLDTLSLEIRGGNHLEGDKYEIEAADFGKIDSAFITFTTSKCRLFDLQGNQIELKSMKKIRKKLEKYMAIMD